MQPKEIPVSHDAAQRYEAARTLAERYIKEVRLDDYAWQWAVWFVFNGDQCGTRCPFWPDICFVGSDTCCECPAFEGIQIITKHTGRVYCKNKKEQLLPWPDDIYFAPEGRDRLQVQYTLPEELCPW